jgi:hypothetical protein
MENNIMMIEDRFFDQLWVQELSNEDFRMLLYLFKYASKCGIIELNMRLLNFAANTGHTYTKDELLSKFRNVLRLVPGRSDTAIMPEYIATNWAKGKPIDVERMPLFRGIVNELASFGLTIHDVNSMSKKKFVLKGMDAKQITEATKSSDDSKCDYQDMFAKFWEAYPSKCPRKVDKKKCLEKFIGIMKASKDQQKEFDVVMSGLKVWCESELWNSDGGKFIKAPLVWLRGSCWLDNPKKGNGNGDKHSATNATSHKEKSYDNLW